MTYKRRVIYFPFFFLFIQPQGKDIPFFLGNEGENLRNPLIFTIFVYANKGFAYRMFNFRDPDGYKFYFI